MKLYQPPPQAVDSQYLDTALQQGKVLRKQVPRSAHATWSCPKDRISVLEQIHQSNQGRVEALLPIRHARMQTGAFAFYRGMAGSMASDLAQTPNTGILIQACGDAHLMNFGLFASPERTLMFDITDFDETHPAPWEWDVKRLAASVVIAGREIGLAPKMQRQQATECVASYRQHLRQYAQITQRDVWYDRLTVETFLQSSQSPLVRRKLEEWLCRALQRTGTRLIEKMTESIDGILRIKDHAPYIEHETSGCFLQQNIAQTIMQYRSTLQEDRRLLLDRYTVVDAARKVVGVGSVGTRCAMALLQAVDGDAFFLQIKEARPSVLEPFTEKSKYAHQGQRVVVGQRMMQSASDAFLGWSQTSAGLAFYVRQLRDMKATVPLELMDPDELGEYAKLCAWALARAHAKSGQSALISGYLGKSDTFEEAVSQFAGSYADQNEQDFAEFQKAVAAGKLPVANSLT